MKNQVLKLLKNLDSMDIASIIDTIKEFSTHKNDINDYLDLMLLWYRDVLMFKVTRMQIFYYTAMNILPFPSRQQNAIMKILKTLLLPLTRQKVRLKAKCKL